MKSSKLAAKAVIVNDSGKVLILRRSQTAPTRPGSSDFPGGIVETSETLNEAVIREIDEETGLTVSPNDLRLNYSKTAFYEGSSWAGFLFCLRMKGPVEIKLSYEHDKYSWLSPNDALAGLDHPVWSAGLKYLIEHDLL